jgi:hypothetical protein
MERRDDWEPDDRLSQLLQPGEQVLWRGKPDRRAYIWSQYPLFVFGLFWFGFAVFWNVVVWTELPTRAAPVTGVISRLFGLPFLVAGFWIAFGQLIHKALEWPKLEYVVTSKRVAILSGSSSPHHVSLFLDSIRAIGLRTTPLDRWRGTGSIAVDSHTPMSLAIADAQDVVRLVERAREQVSG